MSSFLVILYLWIQLSQTLNIINCTSNSPCENADVICNQQDDCIINCINCLGASLYCPINGDCTIECTGDFGCENAMIHANTSNGNFDLSCVDDNWGSQFCKGTKVFGSTLQNNSGNHFNVECGHYQSQCRDAEINCATSMNCNINCAGNYDDCGDANIVGPIGYDLSINCSSSTSCNGMSVGGREASNVYIDCVKPRSCYDITIYCPANDINGIHCNLKGNNSFGTSNGPGVHIYAENGWNDISFDYSGYQQFGGTMYCGYDYQASCLFMNDSFSCADVICNGAPYTRSPSKSPTEIPTISTTSPTMSPTPVATVSALDICDNTRYAGGLSARVFIEHSNSSENIDTFTAKDLTDYMKACATDSPGDIGDIILDVSDDSEIYYNEYIPLYTCFANKGDAELVKQYISSNEFTECVDNQISDNASTRVENILIWLHQFFEAAIPNFLVFQIILIIMVILIVITVTNWIYSKLSYFLCFCSCCGCMAADQANLTAMFMATIRIGDLITDVLISYNIYRYYVEYEINNKYILALTIANICTLLLPYFIINLWTMKAVSTLKMTTDRLREWHEKYRFIIYLMIVITGDAYVSLLLFTSNLFGMGIFDSGLSVWHLKTLRKFKIITILFENIPQMVTQLIFGYVTDDFVVVALSMAFSLCANFVTVISWYMTNNFDKRCMIADYYIEINISKQEQFDDDLSKIRRYSKCRNLLKTKLVQAIKENTSKVNCDVYHVEMIGTGCNIHIIHYLTENTKIKTKSTGSVPVSTLTTELNEHIILTKIYDGKVDAIAMQFKKLWKVKGNVSVDLQLISDNYHAYAVNTNEDLKNETDTQVELHTMVNNYEEEQEELDDDPNWMKND